MNTLQLIDRGERLAENITIVVIYTFDEKKVTTKSHQLSRSSVTDGDATEFYIVQIVTRQS